MLHASLALDDLRDPRVYAAWRDWKLRHAERGAADFVEIANLAEPTAAEVGCLVEACGRRNFAFYRTDPTLGDNPQALLTLGRALGLRRLDANLCAGEQGVTAIEVRAGSRGAGDYIPYTPRRLSWHTDGYYNAEQRRIRGLLMHCVRPARSGGESLFLDPDLLYIWLRDEEPAWVEALCHPRALTIPANVMGGRVIRPAQSGPVFFSDPRVGALGMRYSARSRNIQWRDDAATRDAVAFIESIWSSPPLAVLRLCLGPGEGVVCNNVLHARTDFTDDSNESLKRLLYRARYLDRVRGVGQDAGEWMSVGATVSSVP